MISRSDGVPCVHVSPCGAEGYEYERQGESNVLQCFIFVLQCPLYLLGNWDLIVLYQKRKVKCTLTRGVEGLPIVFLMGYQKQKILSLIHI